MAAKDRSTTSTVNSVATQAAQYRNLSSFIESDRGAPLAFFQALRLMRATFPDDDAFRAGVRVRANLSLAFPSEDIEHIERAEDGVWRVVANFFGLYGVSSPLPTFYTEDLIEEARNGRAIARDFLDVLHAAIYPMLFSVWEKYRIWIACAERDDARGSDFLSALIGQLRGDAVVPPNRRLLHFAGLFSQFPRSALGLETLVRGLLRDVPVSVTPCVARRMPVPPENRSMLGQPSASIGEMLLGQEVEHRSGTAQICVGPVNAQCFETLLPGGAAYTLLTNDLALYLHDPIDLELTVLLEQSECAPAMLGGERWGRLGLDVWLAAQESRDDSGTLSATYELPLEGHRPYVPAEENYASG